jgi:hypothetical protein
MQEFLVYIALALSLFFLVRKYVFQLKKKGSGCNSNCNC